MSPYLKDNLTPSFQDNLKRYYDIRALGRKKLLTKKEKKEYQKLEKDIKTFEENR